MKQQTKYNVIIIKGNQRSLLSYRDRTEWCKRTAMKHCNGVLSGNSGIKDYDDVQIAEA